MVSILLPNDIIRYILEYNIPKSINNLFRKKSNYLYFDYYLSNYHIKLLDCHKEAMGKRPCYYKVSVGGFTPGISDSPIWHYFKKNSTIREWYYINGVANYIELELFAIEITPERPPNDRYWHSTVGNLRSIEDNLWSRDIRLYYGWKRCNDQQFLNQIARINSYQRDALSPGFY